ncbi:bifunctional diaminohydroxyphosphoribosylaminopyrimidine deaminase/5-amino-6-(5-phosphoribosylamino)uracil reductase RibD [bacterium]|nr:bifunctional diaminohydroxyphosphoribosylaminopyrimidine deaminase/5-amino-6-(5-phosphoribosylamino)uracil reductase RibD [bacterium]
MSDSDVEYMKRALLLAEKGRGRVEPNPMVGSVVVKDGRIVGEGYHEIYGGPHGEINAIDKAGDLAKGATLYVTLEPCCHHGKRPPCTERVIASGVRRVVYAMTDPFPLVAGKGGEQLRQAGIEVSTGVLEEDAAALNAPFVKLVTKRRPFVHAKWAMSLDGKIGTANGESKWITGEVARQHSHQFRGLLDAIIVGSRTVRADDPMLTARPAGNRTAARVILDSTASVPLESKLVQTARDLPTVVACTSAAPLAHLKNLELAGCQCWVFPASQNERVPIDLLLDEMGKRNWTNVLVEGGGEAIGAFLDEGEIDAVRIYLGRMVIGGKDSPVPSGGFGRIPLADSLRFKLSDPVLLGGDIFISGYRNDTQ